VNHNSSTTSTTITLPTQSTNQKYFATTTPRPTRQLTPTLPQLRPSPRVAPTPTPAQQPQPDRHPQPP